VLLAAVVALEDVVADVASVREAAYAEALATEGLRVDPAALRGAARDAADTGDELALGDVIAGGAGDQPVDDVARVLAVHRAGRLLAARLRHGGVVLAPGAATAVGALAARLRLALVTTLPRADAAHVLDVAGLGPMFSAVVAGDDRLGAAGTATSSWAAAAERLAARAPRLTPSATAALVATSASAAAARAAGLHAVRVGPMGADTASALSVPHLPSIDGLTPAGLARALSAAPTAPTP
jgi:beta-phosphoglucomutase-like phosphatase (HAD superfamily)